MDAPYGESSEEGLLKAVLDLAKDVAEMRELISERLSTDDVKNKAFERLYGELDRLKRHVSVLDNRPLYLDLFLLDDRLRANLRESTEPQPLIESLGDELREILLRRGIHLISLHEDTFDPRFQQAVLVENVDCQEKDHKVLRTVREGFACGGVVLRPQEVVVGRFSPTTAAPTELGGSASPVKTLD